MAGVPAVRAHWPVCKQWQEAATIARMPSLGHQGLSGGGHYSRVAVPLPVVVTTTSRAGPR